MLITLRSIQHADWEKLERREDGEKERGMNPRKTKHVRRKGNGDENKFIKIYDNSQFWKEKKKLAENWAS